MSEYDIFAHIKYINENNENEKGNSPQCVIKSYTFNVEMLALPIALCIMQISNMLWLYFTESLTIRCLVS